MSERPVEDEIIDQARHFGRALMAMASQHGRAVTWIEQRRIRKEISRALRQQRHAEHLERQRERMWTEQAVNRYRAHAQAVHVRRNHPEVDADRRARDQVSLRDHATDLQQRVLDRRGLTPVEQGIALDGIDAATAFPNHSLRGNKALFAGAKRVKGIDALRYRASVARTKAEMPQRRGELNQQHRELSAMRRARTDAPASIRPMNRDTVNDRPRSTTREQQEAAVQRLRQAQLTWDINAPDAHPEAWRRYDRWVKTAARAAAEAGVSPERIAHEREHAVENSKFTASVYALRPDHDQVELAQSLHPTQRDAAAWTHRTVTATEWAPGTALKAVVHERDVVEPVHTIDGTREQVSAQTEQWTKPPRERQNETRTATAEPTPEADRLAAVEKQLKQIAEDRDQMTSRVLMLQRGLDSVTADRDDMRSKLDAAEGRIASLTNRNQRLAAEIDEVRRDQEPLRAERDQFKTERDEAVARLIKQTPARDRFGSNERVAAAATNTQEMPNPNLNGQARNGRERSH
ncbi:hypothetical protein ACFVVM_03765 [Nocardia sp. NPDC058176]|uniref:hypothetical protein n=1 Tax=Nocardia sp. NPDC058176 TaxID=3346368 RepID=UPI0036D7EF55